MPRRKMSEDERTAMFWSKVRKTKTCWFWMGYREHGYGRLSDGTKQVGAHIYAYRVSCGPTDGKWVLHTCDNKACVRPDHLFLGTHQDNMDDMTRKGRQYRPRSESVWMARLTWAKVRRLRRDGQNKYCGYQLELAKKYGLDQSAVSLILNNKRWVER